MISSKGRYALRVMTYLAVNADREFVPLKEIAEAESISLKYLENIARMLSKEHYIEGTSRTLRESRALLHAASMAGIVECYHRLSG